MSTKPVEIIEVAKPGEPVVVPPPKPNLLQKLASVVAEIDNVDKRGRNEFQKYAYVKATDVAWLVRKALASRNIYLVTDVVEIRNYEIPAKEGHSQAVDLRMEFSFFDGDEPATPPVVLHSWGTGTDKGDKAVYKAMTGALKYGLRHAFLIPDESDPEADIETDKATATAKAVGEAKVAKLKEKAAQEAIKAPQCLFYTLPEAHNGFSAELVNVKEFGSALNEVAGEGLRQILKKYVRTNKAGDLLVSTGEKLEALTAELASVGVPLEELKAARS